MNSVLGIVDLSQAESYSPDLPAWMRPRRRQIDWGLLVVVAVSLLLIWPLAAWPGLPRDSDAALFVARSEQVVEALRSGTLYARWAADFNFGFGSPLFNYLAPLPHMLTGLHELITDADPVNSVKLALGLAVVAAGIGMYLLAGRRYGAIGGVIGALIYLCSTPIAYALPIQTGDLASLLSLALLPWALWALDQLIAHPGRASLLAAVVGLAVWSLADTRLTLLAIPLFGLIVLSGLNSTPHKRESLLLVLWAFGAAVLLTAFFWLPALAERADVVWLPLAVDPRSISISLPDSLLALPTTVSGALDPPPALGLGPGITLAATIVAVIALVGIIRAPRLIRWEAIACGMVGLGAVLLATPNLARWWVQPSGWQPIRPYDVLIGIALPSLALLASQSGKMLTPIRFSQTGERSFPFQRGAWWMRSGILTVLSAIPLLAILPSLSIPAWAPDPALSAPPASIETAIHAIATLRYGLLLPKTAYHASAPLSTIAFATSDANPVALTPARILINVDLPSPFLSRFTIHPTLGGESITFDRFAFPGWWLTVDGEAHTSSIDSAGRIALDVPGTAQAVVIGFGTTPTRTFGWLLTGLGLVALAGRLLSLRIVPDSSAPPVNWARGNILALCIVLTAFTLASIALRLSPITPLSVPNTPIATYPVGIALVDAPTRPIDAIPGATFPLTLVWQADDSVTHDVQLAIRLVPELTAQSSSEPSQLSEWQPGGIPATQWPMGVPIQDNFRLAVPTDVVPGSRYLIQVQIAQCATPQRLPCESPTPVRANGSSDDRLTLPGAVLIDPAG